MTATRIRPSVTEVALIVAMGHGRVIGRDNVLPWRLRADLMRFKNLTMGHTIVMGRKTFQSIGSALPGRDNVVLTRDPKQKIPGCRIARDLETALTSDDDRVFVIGGGHVYEAALPYARRIYVTQVDCREQGDTYFPGLDWSEWSLVGYRTHAADEENDHDMTFMDFRRPCAAAA